MVGGSCKREATAANLELFRRLPVRDYAPASDPKMVPFKSCFLMNARPDDDLMQRSNRAARTRLENAI
jgi:hypothetical protein